MPIHLALRVRITSTKSLETSQILIDQKPFEGIILNKYCVTLPSPLMPVQVIIPNLLNGFSWLHSTLFNNYKYQDSK